MLTMNIQAGRQQARYMPVLARSGSSTPVSNLSVVGFL